MPVAEWNGDDLLKRVDAAAESGLNAACAVLVESVKAKLGLYGATHKSVKRGRAILREVERLGYFKLNNGKVSSQRKRDYIAAFEDRALGRDYRYPQLRTGNLRRAVDFEATGKGRREIGLLTTGAAHVYGPVHEFGSPSQNIPARPVWNPSWKGEQRTMLDAFLKQAQITYDTGAEAPGT